MASDTQAPGSPQAPSSAVREAIARHLAGDQGAAALLRVLLAHPGWLLAPPPPPNGAPHPTVSVTLFSDEPALAAHGRAAPPAPTAGLQAFEHALGLPGLLHIEVNPGSAESVRFQGEDLHLLAHLVRAVRIEALLAELDDLEDPFPTLCAYDSFHVYLSGEGTTTKLLLAPDRQERRLGAVFTAEDACDAFVSSAGGVLPGAARLVRTSGLALFRLLKDMDLEGVVFNCRGPITPRAFSADLFDLVLDRGQGQAPG